MNYLSPIALTLLCIQTVFSQGVGINTTTPDRRLDVEENNGDPQLRLTYTSNIVFTDLSTTATGNFNIVPTGGFVGIGSALPSTELDVNGKTKTTSIQITNGASNNFILKSDANGNASWVNANTVGGDITGVIAGDGLIGGGNGPGAVTLNVLASNGLTDVADAVKLGGTLTENTTINQGINNMVFNLNSSGDFKVMDGGTTRFIVLDNGRVGIGSGSPTNKLDVIGKIKTTNIRVTSGATNNYVLVSNASGDGIWKDINTLVNGDNLGNHTATTVLNMTGKLINNVADPIAGKDAVNKDYLDAALASSGCLKVYKTDGTTLLGDFAGFGASPDERCNDWIYSATDGSGLKFLVSNVNGVNSNGDCYQNTTGSFYYTTTNCTGTRYFSTGNGSFRYCSDTRNQCFVNNATKSLVTYNSYLNSANTCITATATPISGLYFTTNRNPACGTGDCVLK